MVTISQNFATMLAIILLVLCASIHQTTARPKPGPAQNSLDRINGCDIENKLLETCQRCAKATKSNVVYPMCCSNEDDVYVWCEKYIGYGIH